MLNLLDTSYRKNVKLGLATDGPYYDADGAKQNWEMHHFYHTILAASVTILNKLKKGQNRINIPVVMVSAVADDGHKVIASIDGASAYITKPIDRKVLLKTIAHFLPDSES